MWPEFAPGWLKDLWWDELHKNPCANLFEASFFTVQYELKTSLPHHDAISPFSKEHYKKKLAFELYLEGKGPNPDFVLSKGEVLLHK